MGWIVVILPLKARYNAVACPVSRGDGDGVVLDKYAWDMGEIYCHVALCGPATVVPRSCNYVV